MQPMTCDQYAEALQRLGFTNRGFCREIGVNEKTGRDWKSGTSPVPGSVAALLRLMIALDVDASRFAELVAKADA